MKRTLSATVIGIVLAICGCSTAQRGDAQSSSYDSRLTTPKGFRIGLFASGLRGPRLMALSPDGRLFVTETSGGRVTILPDAKGMGRASSHITYASGLNRPHGIAFHAGYLYIAESGRVRGYRYSPGSNKGASPETIIGNIPSGGRHVTRTIAFGSDGKLFLSVGSSCNVCIESNPLRAAIMRYSADGSSRSTYATGLRNAIGLAFNPTTGRLWATVNERDYLGDNAPPDAVDEIREGGFYGWPYAYGNHVPDPTYGKDSPQSVRRMIPPTIPIQAHSAPIDLAFCKGKNFPAQYKGDLFVAYHGSWNRSVATGYKVVRFHFENGHPAGGQENFITGWLQGGSAWGRPAGILFGKHGEMYITDDDGGRVYRVTYSGI